MAICTKKSKLMGVVVGLLLLVGAVCAVVFLKGQRDDPRPEEVVRPLKTTLIGAPYTGRRLEFPGKVKAGEEADLSFEVSGRLKELLVNKGDEVVKGQLIGALDPRDFQNDLDVAIAERDRAEAQHERMAKAGRLNAVSKQEVDNALAAYNQAVAVVDTRQKAMEDTKLYADFDGVIADKFVDNFQNVRANQAIVRLQDNTRVDIEIAVPEDQVARARDEEDFVEFKATFDYLPDRAFDLTVKEWSTEADPSTQTFAVTFRMPAPDERATGMRILPGMTATVHVTIAPVDATDRPDAYALPLDAVPLDDATGRYFVWKVQPTDRPGRHVVTRAFVEVGEMTGDKILITSGVRSGDRIATAGVSLLRDGKPVRLYHAGEAGSAG